MTVQAADKGLFRPRTGARGRLLWAWPGPGPCTATEDRPARFQPGPGAHRAPTEGCPQTRARSCSGEASWPASHQAGGSDGCFYAGCEEPLICGATSGIQGPLLQTELPPLPRPREQARLRQTPLPPPHGSHVAMAGAQTAFRQQGWRSGLSSWKGRGRQGRLGGDGARRPCPPASAPLTRPTGHLTPPGALSPRTPTWASCSPALMPSSFETWG